MKLQIKVGSTSQTVNVFIQDSSSTTGAGLAGLVYNSSGLTAYYALPKAAAVSITLATLAAVTSSYSSGGFKEIDATNMPGWYRFDIPDAALASGRFVSIHLKGATNMAPLPIEIELTAVDNQSATAFITGVNSLAPPSNWNSMVIDGSGRVDVSKVGGTSQTAGDIYARLGAPAGASMSADIAAIAALVAASAIRSAIGLSSANLDTQLSAIAGYIDTEVATLLSRLGTPVGASISADIAAVQSDTDNLQTRIPAALTSNGNLKVSVMEIISTALSEGATGRIAAAFQGMFNVTSPVLTAQSVNQTGDNYARLGAPAGASVSADVAALAALVAAAAIRAALGLGSANLDTQLSAIAAYIDTEVGAIKTVTDQLVAAQSEPTGVPAANATPLQKLAFLGALARNKITQTATTQTLYADNGSTAVATSTHSDDGTTHTKGEFA